MHTAAHVGKHSGRPEAPRGPAAHPPPSAGRTHHESAIKRKACAVVSSLGRYGKWALVTGGSSGLGAQFTRQLARDKVNIAIVARKQSAMDDRSNALV